MVSASYSTSLPFLLPFPSCPPLSTPLPRSAPVPSLPFVYSCPFPSLPSRPFPFHPLAAKRHPVTSLSFYSCPFPPFLHYPFHSLAAKRTPSPPCPSLSSSPSLLHFRWLTVFCRAGCILCIVETSRISVVTDIADRFGGW